MAARPRPALAALPYAERQWMLFSLDGGAVGGFIYWKRLGTGREPPP